MNEIFKRMLDHASSLTLLVTIGIVYLLGDHIWLDQYLPVNGKPLFIFLLLCIVLVYELSIKGQKNIAFQVSDIDAKVKTILTQMEINRLIQAVNGLYGRFVASGDEVIDNEYTIKELSELVDMREKLGVNSYTQGRLEHLTKKVKR